MKLTKNTLGSKIKEVKFNLQNFGADTIYVIHDIKKPQRRIDFEHAWSHFSGFKYEYIDAVTPDHFNLKELIENESVGEFSLGKEFYDSVDLCLTKNILAIAFSHLRAYRACNTLEKGDRFLILEDDARPTVGLMNSIYTGEYKKFIDGIKKRTFDWIFIGTANSIIKGQDYNKFLKRPENFTGLAAHAVLYTRDSINRLVDNHSTVKMAADFLLHHLNSNTTFPNVYSPYVSWISQVHTQLENNILDPNNPDYEYSTGSQVNPLVDKVLEGHPHLAKELVPYIHLDYFEKKNHVGPLIKIKWIPPVNKLLQ